MSLHKYKKIDIVCDGHFTWSCHVSVEGIGNSYVKIIKAWQKSGWLIKPDGHCLCPECQKYKKE